MCRHKDETWLSCCATYPLNWDRLDPSLKQISRIPTFLVRFLLLKENPTKFLLIFCHSYGPNFKTPEVLHIYSLKGGTVIL